nr:hypothetical protein [Arthrospira sp. PLM2.Bin9]
MEKSDQSVEKLGLPCGKFVESLGKIWSKDKNVEGTKFERSHPGE